MTHQPTFSDLEASSQRATRPRRRADFLATLDRACPWAAWEAEVEAARAAARASRGASAGAGRPPVPAGTMLRMYVLQVCFSLSDEGVEEQALDSASMRRFVGCAPSEVPDATSMCRFRRLLESCSFGDRMLAAVNEAVAGEGLRVSAGSLVDAAFVESPSSTKNASGSRDPEAHQAKKGQVWHFGYKAGVGVDAETGVPHSVRVDPANVGDLAQLPDLLRRGDAFANLDAGYTGAAARPEIAGDPALSRIELRVAARRSSVTEGMLADEAGKASARSAVEHVFHIVKDLFGLRKTRMRGLARVSQQVKAAVSVAAALIALRGPRPFGPPGSLAPANIALKAERLRARAERRAARAAEREERERARFEREARRRGYAPAA